MSTYDALILMFVAFVLGYTLNPLRRRPKDSLKAPTDGG
jgi:hypothetical protein